MATRLENIAARIDAIYEEIAAGEHSKPTYTSGARTVQWGEYKAGLLEELKTLRELEKLESGPFVIKQVMG